MTKIALIERKIMTTMPRKNDENIDDKNADDYDDDDNNYRNKSIINALKIKMMMMKIKRGANDKRSFSPFFEGKEEKKFSWTPRQN